MSEKKVQGMGLEGGEGELATVAIYPRAADGVSCWGASGWCGGSRMASRGGARGGRAACATCRGGGAMREDKSVAVELIGVQTGAVRSTERCGTLARGQQRGGVGPGEAGEGRVAVQRWRGRPVGGNPRRRRPTAVEQISGGAGGRRKVGGTCLKFVKTPGTSL